METEEKTRILVIEDSAATATLLRLTLEHAGFAVRVAPNGRLAYELVRHNPFDLVITDEQMPEMSGLEFCRYFRKTAVGRDVPIILLTAKKLELDALQISRDLQIGLILGKPFSPKGIVRDVTRLLDEASQSVSA
jgi:DNA-binding response OmpR family regulator